MMVSLPWLAMSHWGALDGWKTTALDWSFQLRGELEHIAENQSERVRVGENNQTVPRLPKVVYVNFDADTLAMPGIGERPWDRRHRQCREAGKP